MSKLIHPFSGEELQSLNKGRSFSQRLYDYLPWSERRKLIRMRERRIVDSWVNPGDWLPPEHAKGGGSVGWAETLEAITADGTQISNTVTETIVCPDFNIPAYYMAPGRTFRIWAFGVMSNVVTTPGTLILRVRWGGAAGTVLVASAAQGLDTTARTNSMWMAMALITCRSAGATGTFMSGGILWSNVLSSTAANLLPALMGSAGAPLASANAAVTVDTTTAKLLSVTAQFSVATSPTNLTAQQRLLEVLN